MSVLSRIKVYSTTPHKCSYLDGKEATTLFVDPAANINEVAYTELSEIGFRRSGKHYYRPHCHSCDDCVPARIPVQNFKLTRRQSRILNKNRELEIARVNTIDSDEHYALYERYINTRHREGDMYPPSRNQYEEFLVSNTGLSRYTEYRLKGELVAISVSDEMPAALSAIYTFFDPTQAKRSLGSFAILNLIEQAREAGMTHLYLGYWIKECRKMSYKIEFRPIELLISGSWRKLT